MSQTKTEIVRIIFLILFLNLAVQSWAQDKSSNNSPSATPEITSQQSQPSPTPSLTRRIWVWMGDERWKFAGVVVAIAALIVALLNTRRQRRRKALSYSYVYDVLTNPLVSGIKGEEHRLKILFDDKPIPNLSSVRIVVYNSGNQPIPAEDFVKPITFNFGVNAKVLEAGGFTTPRNIETSLSKDGDNEIGLRPVLLNPGDSVSLFFFVSGFNGKLDVSARAVGISQVKGLNLTERQRLGVEPHPRFNSWLLQFIILGWGFTFITGGWLSQLWAAFMIGQSMANLMNLRFGPFSNREYLILLIPLVVIMYIVVIVASLISV